MMTPNAIRMVEWMRRMRVTPRVQERVIRLNPDPQPGMMLRGWHRKQTAKREFQRDLHSRNAFEAKWGKGSAHGLPKEAFWRAGGKRRWIAGSYMHTGPRP